jgi:hypothetical protein
MWACASIVRCSSISYPSIRLVAHGTDAETLTPQDCSENLREGWGLLAKPLDELDTGNEDQEVGVNIILERLDERRVGMRRRKAPRFSS